MQECTDRFLQLLKTGKKPDIEEISEILINFRCTSGIEAIIEGLQDGNIQVRKMALKILEKIEQTDLFINKYRPVLSSALIDDLKNTYWPVRSFAARILGKLGEKKALEPLIYALGDTEGYVRYFAVEALGRLGDITAVPYLVDTIVDDRGNVRNYVVDSIKLILEAFPDIPTPQDLIIIEYNILKLKKYDAPCIMELLKLADRLIKEKKSNRARDIIIVDDGSFENTIEIVEVV